ncbi:MAG: helix-turn-helix domain-containing protein [Verrucomicrobiota bacterium]
MPNIGDRLEEARKRQGISIREASEATKIRGDLLLSLENNNFDFDLPDVYKRGFLKLYGKYLKLDTDKLMTDFDAVMMGRSKVKRSDSREFFGRMDLPERTTPLGSKESTPPFSAQEGNPRAANEGQPAEPIEQQADTSLYWKIGLIFLGTFVIVGLLALLIQGMFSSSSDDADTGGGSSSIVENTDGGEAVPGEVTLIGLGDSSVVVKQLNTNEKIASGSLETGEEITFTRVGPIVVVSDSIENVMVRIDGNEFRPEGQSGLMKWYFDENGPY